MNTNQEACPVCSLQLPSFRDSAMRAVSGQGSSSNCGTPRAPRPCTPLHCVQMLDWLDFFDELWQSIQAVLEW